MFLRIIYFFINKSKNTCYKIKINLNLYINNFFIPKTHKSFYKLVINFTFSSIFNLFSIKILNLA